MSMKKIGLTFLALSLVLGVTLAMAEEEEQWTREYSAEVMKVDGNTVVAKMGHDGLLRTFNVASDREFVVDGETITVKDLLAGTVLTATITSKPAPEAIEITTGKVLWRTGNTVVLKTTEGEVKQYTVDSSFMFNVAGDEKSVGDLTPGTNLTATWITEDPMTVVTPDTPITGKGPS